MAIDRKERLSKLAQLREQVASLNAEIARLEREDPQFVAYLDRARAANLAALSYTDFARYFTAFEQLEAEWVRAGRPQRDWPRLDLLARLRAALALQPAAAAANGSAVAAPDRPPPRASAPETRSAVEPGLTARAPADSPSPQAQSTTTAPPPAARTVVPAAPAAPRLTRTPVRPAASPTPQPTPAGRTAPASPLARPSAPTPATPEPAAPKMPSFVMPKATREQLVEMHSPILNEVVELMKRGGEELKASQPGQAVNSARRAIYMLERVVFAPPAMTNQLMKLANDVGKNVGALNDADRVTLESIRERVQRLLEETRE